MKWHEARHAIEDIKHASKACRLAAFNIADDIILYREQGWRIKSIAYDETSKSISITQDYWPNIVIETAKYDGTVAYWVIPSSQGNKSERKWRASNETA